MDGLQSFFTLFEKYSVPLIISGIVIFVGVKLAGMLIKQMEKRSEMRMQQEKEKGELEIKNRRMEIERREQEQKLLYEVQTEQVTQMKNMSDTLEKIQVQMYEFMNNINGDISGLSSNINLMWSKYDAIKEKTITTDKSVSEIKDILDEMSKDLHILLKNVEELSRNAGKTEQA